MIQKGITLLEMLIAMGIASVVGILLLAIIVNSAGLYTKESTKLSQGVSSNDALSQIRETIKESSGVLASYTVSGTTYTSGSSQIVLKLASIDSSNNLISSTFDYFVFFSDTNKLRLKTYPDASSARKAQDQIFSTSLDLLNFKYYNLANPPLEVTPASALKVKITLSLKQKNGNVTESKIATSEALLRND